MLKIACRSSKSFKNFRIFSLNFEMTIAWSLVALLLKLFEFFSILTNTTKVVLEAQWGICPAPCVLSQYTVVFA